MTIEQARTDTQPPDPLIEAFEYLDAWEQGQAIEYSPEGLALLRRLQQARIGRQGLTAAGVEAEV